MRVLLDLVARHRNGEAVGIASLCSAHPLVVEAALRHAQARGLPQVLFEATCNQVNQDGGYTGMRPEDFVRFVHGIAADVGFDPARIALGGDHLGPQPWTALGQPEGWTRPRRWWRPSSPPASARSTSTARCPVPGDPVPLPRATIVDAPCGCAGWRKAAWARSGGEHRVYVIGTEVPVPSRDDRAIHCIGGDHAGSGAGHHRRASRCLRRGGPGRRMDARDRVVGRAAGRGKFDHHEVIDYAPDKARAQMRSRAYPAWSTKRIPPTTRRAPRWRRLCARPLRDPQGMGPGLTFALREALWALDAIEREWIPAKPARRPARGRAFIHARPARALEALLPWRQPRAGST